MPEGPSLVILRDSLESFKGKKIIAAGGYTKMQTAWLQGEILLDIKTWGKHLLFCFSKAAVRIHLRLFGSVLVNKRKEVNASFFLRTENGEMNFYVVEALKLDLPLEEIYDWRTDIMAFEWNRTHVKKLLLEKKEALICDVLLDQSIFSGVGNIIRNEVLYRCRIHPLNLVADLPDFAITKLLKDVRSYGKFFLQKRLEDSFARTWEAHQQKTCPRDDKKFTIKIIGKTRRKAYYCSLCQENY